MLRGTSGIISSDFSWLKHGLEWPSILFRWISKMYNVGESTISSGGDYSMIVFIVKNFLYFLIRNSPEVTQTHYPLSFSCDSLYKGSIMIVVLLLIPLKSDRIPLNHWLCTFCVYYSNARFLLMCLCKSFQLWIQTNWPSGTQIPFCYSFKGHFFFRRIAFRVKSC